MRTRDIKKEKVIREKGIEMIVKEGFDRFSMQKLARVAGVSPATIYIYFKDKDDFIIQLCVEAGKKMFEATLKDFDPAMSFRDGLKMQWVNRAKYCLKNPVQMDFLEQIKHSPMQERAYELLGDNFKETMHAFVSNAIKRKELVKVPLEVYWSVAFAPLYALIKFHLVGKSIGGRPFKMTDAVMMNTLELVLKALKP